MKVFILCGGLGTRLDYEGKVIAKPMVRVGPDPILMHIIKNFCNQNFNEFIFCLGYKSNTIADYFLKEKTKKVDRKRLNKNYIRFNYNSKSLNFKGHLIYTGLNSGTGGRILKSYNMLNLNEDILMTYGDGLSNVNIKKLIKFHKRKKSEVTITAVRPKVRYGVLKINKERVKLFDNSNGQSDVYINGGFFVISKNAIKKIKNKNTYWEKEPLAYFLKKKKLYAFKHNGFWKSLDTLKDKNDFNEMIKQKKRPWII